MYCLQTISDDESYTISLPKCPLNELLEYHFSQETLLAISVLDILNDCTYMLYTSAAADTKARPNHTKYLYIRHYGLHIHAVSHMLPLET